MAGHPISIKTFVPYNLVLVESKDNEIRIGCDLDGVVAKHSLSGFWVKVRLLKEKLLKKTHTKEYYYPATKIEQIAWKLINSLRVPDSKGIVGLKDLHEKGCHFFLITSRFEFNEPSTLSWLKKYRLSPLFDKIIINVQDKSPIDFKAGAIMREKIDFFVDDDLEVLFALEKTKAKLFWVVPGHRNHLENHRQKIHSCHSFAEALREINEELISTGELAS